MTPEPLAKAYEPRDVEARWYAFWEGAGFFTAGARPSSKPFAIVIPPPNVTGALHIGHAFTNSLQDVIIRWRRMQGHNVLWLPGLDHASGRVRLGAGVLEVNVRRERAAAPSARARVSGRLVAERAAGEIDVPRATALGDEVDIDIVLPCE